MSPADYRRVRKLWEKENEKTFYTLQMSVLRSDRVLVEVWSLKYVYPFKTQFTPNSVTIEKGELF